MTQVVSKSKLQKASGFDAAGKEIDALANLQQVSWRSSSRLAAAHCMEFDSPSATVTDPLAHPLVRVAM